MYPDFCTINLTREHRKVRRKCRSALYCCHLFDHWRVWDVERQEDLQTGWQGLVLLSCRTVRHPGRNTVGVRLSSHSRSGSRQLTAARCKSITCGLLQPLHWTTDNTCHCFTARFETEQKAPVMRFITFDRPLLSITQSLFTNYWIFCILFIRADSNKLVYLICWTD